MHSTATSGPTVVEVRRTIAAPPEKVFQAWIEPERMKQWFCRGGDEATVNIYAAEARPGGRLHLDVTHQGKLYELEAEYREVKPPEKLSFTWQWKQLPDHGSSLVSVEFRRLGESNFTEVILRHEGLPTAASCKDHEQGWKACFDMLEKHKSYA